MRPPIDIRRSYQAAHQEQAEVMARSRFLGGMGGGMQSALIRAATDPRRDEVYDAVLKHYKDKGLPVHLAHLAAHDATSPYQALKWYDSFLPRDAEELLETEIIETARKTRNVVNDLISRGLVRPLPNIGVETDIWQEETDFEAAQVSMALAGGPAYDALRYQSNGTPIPIIQKRFALEFRKILAAANNGTPLDTRHAMVAAAAVADAEENLVINGASSVKFDTFTLHGLLTTTDAQSVSGATWATTSNVEANIREAMGKLIAAKQVGPTIFYAHPDQYTEALADHSANFAISAIARVLQIPNVEDLKFNHHVPTGTCVGVVMNGSVDLAIAQNTTTIPWSEEGDARQIWRVFSSLALRVKKDADGNVGVVKITGI